MPNGIVEGWDQYQKLVLAELERLGRSIEGLGKKIDGEIDIVRTRNNAEIGELRDQISNIKTEVALLQLKAGIWGAAAGAIPVALLLIAQFIGK